FSSRRRHTRSYGDWSSDVCSSDLLLQLTTELGLSDVVCFAGFVEQPFERWAGARLYVQPSRQEGFGLAVAEAMAGGLPVVASARSEERRVGKEGRAVWAADVEKER